MRPCRPGKPAKAAGNKRSKSASKATTTRNLAPNKVDLEDLELEKSRHEEEKRRYDEEKQFKQSQLELMPAILDAKKERAAKAIEIKREKIKLKHLRYAVELVKDDLKLAKAAAGKPLIGVVTSGYIRI